MRRVVKFGGSSLASARQFKRVVDIIKSDKSRKYAVPFAPGKWGNRDEKVTDPLYACHDVATEERSYRRILEKIKSRYVSIIDGLDLNLNLDHEFDRIGENLLVKAGWDCTASRGKYLNGIVVANFPGSELVDAAEVTFLGKNGNFESEHTSWELSERLGHVEKAVIPDFRGSESDRTIRAFSRGGSDVTSFIVAETIHADIYENWADVSGVLVTDPRTVENPGVVGTVTYKELRELSYVGADVLHEDAIFPVRKGGIPIDIRDTNRPEDKGTLIVENTCYKSCYTITGIADEKEFCSINVEKTTMNVEVESGRKAFNVFEQYGTSFEHMPSGIDAMTVHVHQPEFEEFEQSVIAGIHRVVKPNTMKLESDLALTAVVGQSMHFTRGAVGRILPAPAHARVNVKMIDQGSSKQNITIDTENDDSEMTIRATYDVFVIMEL